MPQYPTYEANQLLRPTGIPDLSTGTGIARGLAALGQAGGEIADDLLKEQRIEAQARGAERGPTLVYKDQDGTTRATEVPPLDTVEGRAARATQRVAFLTQTGSDFENTAKVLAAKHRGDPQGFWDEYNDYQQRQVAATPESLLPETRSLLGRIGNQYHAGIIVDTDQRQQANDQAAWSAGIKQTGTELLALHDQQLAGDPRTAEAATRFDQQLKLGVAKNYISQDGADLMREQTATDGMAAGIAGMVVNEARGLVAAGATWPEAFKAANDRLDKIDAAPETAKLSPAERDAYRARTLKRLREYEAAGKADTTELDQEVSLINAGVNTGMKYDPIRLDQIQRQYIAAGQPEKAAGVRLLAERAPMIQGLSSMTVPELQRTQADLLNGTATPETVRKLSAVDTSISIVEKKFRDEVYSLRQDMTALLKGEGMNMGNPMAVLDAMDQKATRLRDLGDRDRDRDRDRDLADAVLLKTKAVRSEIGEGKDLSLPALVQELNDLQKQYPTPEKVAGVDVVKRMIEDKSKALDADALTYGAQWHSDVVGQLKQLDFSQVGTSRAGEFTAALQERKRQAATISNAEGSYPVAPLTAPELATAKRVIETGNADQKSAFAAALNDGLGDDGLAELTPHLFKGEAKQRAFGVAAEIASQSPDTARAIFVGQDILDGRGGEKVSAMPPAADVVRKYQEALYPVFDPFGSADPTEAMTRQAMSAVTDRYQATTDAATAYYAYLARGQDNPNFDRLLGQAVTAVTGGVLSGPNGTKIMAPRRGMTQNEFDGLWGNLTADDLGEIAPALNGQRITVDQVRRHGALQSVGEGEYFVFIQLAGGPHQLMRPDRKTLVVIDLSRKVAAPASRWPGSIGLFN